MRNITIDFTNAPPLITDKYAGEIGEHQAVTLNIIPETNMSTDTDIAFYYVLFKVEGGLVASRTFSQGEDISIALWGQLLEDRRLTFQLIGTNGIESIISKTPILTLYLGDSLEGTVIGIDDNRDSLIALIGGFNERLEEVEGDVSSLDSEVIKAIKKADGTLLTVTDNSVTLPDYALSSALNAKENKANKTNTISSSSTNTNYPSAKAVYDFVMNRATDITGMTGNEIRTAWGNNLALKYSGFAIISVQDYTYNSTEGIICEYSKYEYTRNDNQILFYCAFVPNTDTTITDAGSLTRTGITLTERMNGLIGAANLGFVKGGQVYEALLNYYTRAEIDNKGFLTSIPTASTSTLGGVKVDGTSISIDANGVISSSGGSSGAIDITGMTGNEIRTAWTNNKVLKYNGDLITSCQDYTYESTSGVLVGHYHYAVVRNADQATFWFAFIPNTGTTITDVTSLNRVGLTINERSTGAVVQGNGGFVKGGQVFDAIQTWLSNLPVASTSQLGLVKVDGSTITINDGVISSSGGGGASAVIVNFSMENDELVADKTIAEIATAYNNGSIVLAKLIDEDMGIELVYQLNVCFAEEGYAFCEFYSVFNDGENNVLNFAIIGFNEGEDDTWVSETPLAIPKAGQLSVGDTGYAVAGDVYAAIGNVESVLAELIGGA